MRLVGALFRRLGRSTIDILTWRARLTGTGIRLRLRSLLSTLTVLAGLGAAVGFKVVQRLEQRASDAEDEHARSPE